jgi:hypothetical protein
LNILLDKILFIQSGSSKTLLQKRNTFMSQTDSSGHVQTMSSGGSSGNSYMINSQSNGQVQGLINNGNGASSMVNSHSNDMDFGELDLASILSSHLEIPLTEE